jgi:hypothetical protein
MRKKFVATITVLFLLPTAFSSATSQTPASPKSAYPKMAPLDRYLIPDQSAEIKLARSAAPASISDAADVMVLGPSGYATAAKGKNGFLCLVERSWAKPTDDSEFWNPSLRAPICFNFAAAQTFVPIYLMKTKLVLAGKSPDEVLKATDVAFSQHELPTLASGAMCYMMSKQQYLGDQGKAWHPHLMYFAPPDAAKNWGANLPGSPVIAADDPQERTTIMMVVVHNWSDGTPAPLATH